MTYRNHSNRDKRKLLIISYGIREQDGRLKELVKVMRHIGECDIVCCTREKTHIDEAHMLYIGDKKHLTILNYLKFIIRIIKTITKTRKYDVIVSDNMFSALPTLLLKRFLNTNIQYIQDVRELYLFEEIEKKWLKVINWCESRLMSEVDVVLCANRQRADIMKKIYSLDKTPLIFENIRILDGSYDEKYMENKYKGEFSYKYNLVSTGGYSFSRRTDILVKSMDFLDSNYGLYIVGGGTLEDEQAINKLINDSKYKNIHLVDKVSMDELRFILSKSQIGVVHYGNNDLNSQYCASGKVYEFIAEGLPLVTTENKPLKDFCVENQVGIADDTFWKAITDVSENLNYFKKNVQESSALISVKEYNYSVSEQIINMLKNK